MRAARARVRSGPVGVEGFRPEVQALRALAVLAVVLFHLWPRVLPGGFVGVDVFFAISGFLITGHLLREAAGGGIHLPAFWARRIRRLFPAAVIVLAASLIGTILFVPQRLWAAAAEQIGAASVAALNWVLAANSVDYFAADASPTAVQHYWSLAVEEQFYLIWPLLLVVVVILMRRRPVARTRALASMMGGVVAASLAWSVYATSADRAPAYFSTFTHAWEFAAGGMLALGSARLERSKWMERSRLRAAGTWVGFAAIVAAIFLFDGKSPFPGWIAILPISGTLLVIASGVSPSRLQRPLLLRTRAVQLVGDISYSVYLWHWPPIVILPFVLGHALGPATRLAILVAALIAGWLSKRFIEDPVRLMPSLRRRPSFSYALAAPVVLALVLACVGTSGTAARAAADAQAAAQRAVAKELADPCFGASAMKQTSGACPASHEVRAGFSPDQAADDWGSIAGVKKDGTLPDPPSRPCRGFSGSGARFLDCPLVDGTSSTTIALVGDSHALALTEPIVRIARAQGWSLRGILLNSCTPSLPVRYTDQAAHRTCNSWRSAMVRHIADDPSISVVVSTGFSRSPVPDLAEPRAQLIADYAGADRRWTDAGKAVVVIGDVPLTAGSDVPTCVEAAHGRADPCTRPRAEALADDPALDAAQGVRGVQRVSLDSGFCDAYLCHAVVGGLIAYRDSHHLTASFALTLIPLIEPALRRAAP